jgi:hypothetical protein
LGIGAGEYGVACYQYADVVCDVGVVVEEVGDGSEDSVALRADDAAFEDVCDVGEGFVSTGEDVTPLVACLAASEFTNLLLLVCFDGKEFSYYFAHDVVHVTLELVAFCGTCGASMSEGRLGEVIAPLDYASGFGFGGLVFAAFRCYLSVLGFVSLDARPDCARSWFVEFGEAFDTAYLGGEVDVHANHAVVRGIELFACLYANLADGAFM